MDRRDCGPLIESAAACTLTSNGDRGQRDAADPLAPNDDGHVIRPGFGDGLCHRRARCPVPAGRPAGPIVITEPDGGVIGS